MSRRRLRACARLAALWLVQEIGSGVTTEPIDRFVFEFAIDHADPTTNQIGRQCSLPRDELPSSHLSCPKPPQ
jgi:hypothetical protein